MTAEDDPGIGDDDLLHRRVLNREDMVAFAHGVIVGDPAWPDAELRRRRNWLRARFALTWGSVTV